MTIGEKIKEIRLLKGMKQSELAEKAGISRVAIGNYERGDRQPNIDILSKIAIALDSDISDLVPSGQLKKRGYPIRYNPQTIQIAIEKSMKESDPYYDIRSQAQTLDMVNSILDIAKTDTSFWEEVAPLDDETLARYFKAIMTTIGLSGVISMHDKDIKTLLLSDEFKHFIDLLMLKYDTSKDSDN